MRESLNRHLPSVVLAAIALVLFVAQWLVGNFPLWLFATPVNLLIFLLWVAALVEGYRRRADSKVVRYLLSSEATYTALAVAALIALVLGLQSEPATTSWPVVGGAFYLLTILSLVILRGWRNKDGVRWRFLITHLGLWLGLVAMFFGAPDTEILRMQVEVKPSREAVNEQCERRFLDYEIGLDNFVVEQTDEGAPKRFCATVRVDDKVVDIEVNSPYSHHYGEDIYLVSYASDVCVLQIVREPWRVVSAVGVAMLILGALMLFLQGFKRSDTK